MITVIDSKLFKLYVRFNNKWVVFMHILTGKPFLPRNIKNEVYRKFNSSHEITQNVLQG